MGSTPLFTPLFRGPDLPFPDLPFSSRKLTSLLLSFLQVTYPLHVILRYDIERALLNGEMKVEDVPVVWRERMQDDLGVTVLNDALGCLQAITCHALIFISFLIEFLISFLI